MTNQESNYNKLSTKFKTELKSMLLGIIESKGKVYLHDLSTHIRGILPFNVDFRIYTDHALACIWDLETSDIERFHGRSGVYVSMVEF